MARNDPAERLGQGPCPHCRWPVVYKRTKGGYVRFSCQGCQSYGYAEEGGSTCKDWLASITADPAPAPAPGAKPADLPPAAPPAASRKSPPAPPKAPASVFNLGSL